MINVSVSPDVAFTIRPKTWVFLWLSYLSVIVGCVCCGSILRYHYYHIWQTLQCAYPSVDSTDKLCVLMLRMLQHSTKRKMLKLANGCIGNMGISV